MDQLILVDTLSDATAWRKKNPHAYRQIVEWAREDVANAPNAKHPCSMALYFELLRRPHFAYKLGMTRASASVMLPNALRADLARLVMRENADLRGKFRIAHTHNDDWGGRES